MDLRRAGLAVGFAAALLAGPAVASADDCPGFAPIRETLYAADSVVLVRVVDTPSDPYGPFPFGTYDFTGLRAYKGSLGSTFTLTGSALSCQWPRDHVAVGDRFVIAFGAPDENGQRLRSYWQLDSDDSIVGEGHLPSEPVPTLRELERLIARYALRDTATMDDDLPPGPARNLLWSVAAILSAFGVVWSLRRRRAAISKLRL